MSPSLITVTNTNMLSIHDLVKKVFEHYSNSREPTLNKSIAMNAGFKIYNDDDIYLFINHDKLNVVEESKYLGLIINKNNDGNEITLSKYKTVQRCFFSLNGFGMKPPGVNPGIKAFIYKTYCLPKCTYGMGFFNLNKKTIKPINVPQNNLFRYAHNIPYKTQFTLIMKSLKILDATTLSGF
jgi:hypothetical protein